MSKCLFCMEFEAELCSRCGSITEDKNEIAFLRAEVEQLRTDLRHADETAAMCQEVRNKAEAVVRAAERVTQNHRPECFASADPCADLAATIAAYRERV